METNWFMTQWKHAIGDIKRVDVNSPWQDLDMGVKRVQQIYETINICVDSASISFIWMYSASHFHIGIAQISSHNTKFTAFEFSKKPILKWTNQIKMLLLMVQNFHLFQSFSIFYPTTLFSFFFVNLFIVCRSFPFFSFQITKEVQLICS